MVELKNMTIEELTSFVKNELGEPAFRAKQIYSWLYRGAESFDEMTNLSKDLREKLKKLCHMDKIIITERLCSSDNTVKYLFELEDGERIESVLMKYEHGYSACLSTQAGCAMGCAFCASGLMGKNRNLTAAEIINQAVYIMKDRQVRLSNIVLMGIGEPLDNYDNVLTFIKNTVNEKGLGIGVRHISLSTCGLCDKIDKLAKEGLGITLSVSLHAPNDEIRDKIMPINRRYNMDKLLASCRNYINKTGRRISFEYTLIDGVNDSKKCAIELAGRLRNMQCHVNLIPANKVLESGLKGSDSKTVRNFQNILQDRNINATVRRSLGRDIEASCGQLRQSRQNEKGGIKEC